MTIVEDSSGVEIGDECKARNVFPPSCDQSQMLRCVPVPHGPLTYTFLPEMRMSGSPKAWIGSTIVALPKVTLGACAAGVDEAAASGTANAPAARTASIFFMVMK